MTDFSIKQNDTSPALKFQLQDETGSPVDVTGFNTLRFLMSGSPEQTPVVDENTSGNVTVVDAAEGVVRYEWQGSDTDTPGSYIAEWEVEYSDGTVETFPNTEYIIIYIKEDID